jgi:transcriptional regulator with XRE-family HTH domain
MEYVKEFKRLRQEQKKSIRAVSALSGVPASTIEKWEYMGIEPTAQTLNKALNAIGYELRIVTAPHTDS